MDGNHPLFKDKKFQDVISSMQKERYCLVNQKDYQLNQQQELDLKRLKSEYEQLPLDRHLNAGEGGRYRRYGRFYFDPKTQELLIYPHDSFFQSAKFDELYGDIHRHFAPLSSGIINNTFFQKLLTQDFNIVSLGSEDLQKKWEISVHIIRIQVESGNFVGRPAPEGIHQDGYHYGVARLFDRQNIMGGESRVHNLQKEIIGRGYLLKPLDALYMDDRAIFHSVQAFVAENPDQVCRRDIMITLYQPIEESPQKKSQPVELEKYFDYLES